MHLICWGEEPEGKPGALRVQTFCGQVLTVDFAAWVAGRADVTYDNRAATCGGCVASSERLLEAGVVPERVRA